MTRPDFEKRVSEVYGELSANEVIIECDCGYDECLGWQITTKGLAGGIATLMTGGCAANKPPATRGTSPVQSLIDGVVENILRS